MTILATGGDSNIFCVSGIGAFVMRSSIHSQECRPPVPDRAPSDSSAGPPRLIPARYLHVFTVLGGGVAGQRPLRQIDNCGGKALGLNRAGAESARWISFRGHHRIDDPFYCVQASRTPTSRGGVEGRSATAGATRPRPRPEVESREELNLMSGSGTPRSWSVGSESDRARAQHHPRRISRSSSTEDVFGP